jgi:hypothetical protein
VLCAFSILLYSDIGSVCIKNQCLGSVQLAHCHVYSEELASLMTSKIGLNQYERHIGSSNTTDIFPADIFDAGYLKI